MSGKKVIGGLVLLLTFIVAVVGSVTLFQAIRPGEPFLSTTSPQGTYTVRLTGRPDRPRVPFVEHEVRFSVTKDAKTLLANKFLHSGDWLDPSFELWCPEHSWLSEQILQFHKKEFRADGAQESILVVNKTSQTILYLRVASVDTFLLLDAPPGSTTTLAVSAPRTDSRWIGVDGEFAGGRPIEIEEAGFAIAKGKKGPFVYHVYVNENDVAIESSDFQKANEPCDRNAAEPVFTTIAAERLHEYG